MKISTSKPSLLCVCLTLFLVSSTSHAEIYKWVDAAGTTHYSERIEDAGNAKTVELKYQSQPISAQAASSSPKDWQEQDRRYKERQAQKLAEKLPGPSATARSDARSQGRSDETNASRCTLARDVISGAVRHGNLAPIDKNDRDVAENDIRAFCPR